MGQAELRVLGPLDIVVDGVSVSLGGRKQRAVLAALVSAHPNPVSSDQLVDDVWGSRPPATAHPTLQAYVSRLRKTISPLGMVVASGPLGYRLEIDDENALDANRFVAALETARRAARRGRHAEVVTVLEPALALWRSDQPLDLEGEVWAADYVARLTGHRREARALLTDAHLALGDSASAALVLQAEAQNQPFDETVVEKLLVALHRAGRASEALAAYERFRGALADELGLDPSLRLQDVHRMILAGASQLTWRSAGPPLSAPPLPPRNPRFWGRDTLREDIGELLDEHRIVTLHGLAGCGKSALALEIAHRHTSFAAWINAEDRASMSSALADIAANLGVDAGAGESALVLALHRRLDQIDDWLLVLDNVEDVDAVRFVLPPSRKGRVLLTSQSPSWGGFGATVEIKPFVPWEAVDFVLHRSGRADRQGAQALAEQLGNHPLALEQACAYVEEAGLGLDDYLRMFRRSHERLLSRGAPVGHRATVTATWRLLFDRVRSRSQLAATVLEISAFLSPDGVDLSLLEPLAGGDEVDFADTVAQLLRFSLMERDGKVLRVHRLVQTVLRGGLTTEQRRQRAAEAAALVAAIATGEPTAPQNWPGWALAGSQIAAMLTSVGSDELPDGLLHLALDCCRFYKCQGALRSAHEVIDAAIRLGEAAGAGRLFLAELSAERGDLLDAEGELAAAGVELESALAAVEAVADVDELLLARVRVRLGHVRNCADRPTEALQLYLAGIDVLSHRSDPAETSRALIGLGYTYWSLDDFVTAEAWFRQALEVLRAAEWEVHPLMADAVSGLGMMLHEQGVLEEARDAQLRALDILSDLYGDTDQVIVAHTQDKLGYVLGLLGELQGSREQHALATACMRRIFGDHDARYAMALTNLGLAEARLGRIDAARDAQARALDAMVDAYGPDHRHAKLIAGRLAQL